MSYLDQIKLTRERIADLTPSHAVPAVEKVIRSLHDELTERENTLVRCTRTACLEVVRIDGVWFVEVIPSPTEDGKVRGKIFRGYTLEEVLNKCSGEVYLVTPEVK